MSDSGFDFRAELLYYIGSEVETGSTPLEKKEVS
jgi:hypothetical protein